LRAVAEDLTKPPEHRIGLPVTPGVREEAERLLASCNASLRPAERDTVTRWLGALGPLVAGNMPLEDARTRIAGYVAIIDAPPMCFTKNSLKNAAARFKWFPSVAELSTMFDEITARTREIRFQASRVAAAKIETPRQKEARDRVENPAFKSAMADWEKFKAGIGQKGEVA
jgi:hypothetical protein